ncbi:MAG: chemotaxis protein CheW [Cyanobacteriota bacterium]
MLISEEDELLLKRTEELSKQINVDQAESFSEEKEFFSFSINKIKYAMEKFYITELHPSVSPKKVPFTPNYIRGIVNIRGEILSVMDLALFFDKKPIEKKDDYQMIRMKNNKIEFGVLVDTISSVIYLKNKDILPFSVSDNQNFKKFVLGITTENVHIINANTFFSDPKIIIDEVVS